MKFCDVINIGLKKAFKHDLTDVTISILIITKIAHFEDFDGWIILYYLSNQTKQ